MVKPSRGIRQGDSLSPYLFLLCVEALSQILDQVQEMRKFQGMKLVRHCPKVSHLFFLQMVLCFSVKQMRIMLIYGCNIRDL